MKTIVINISRKKLIIGLIISMFLVGLCVKMILSPVALEYSFVYNHLGTIRFIGTIGLVFSLITCIFFLYKLFGNQIGLTISKEGIFDNTSLISVGLIKWNDITGIGSQNFGSNKALLVHVSNPEAYLRKSSNIFQNYLQKLTIKMCGTPISISAALLTCSFEELELLLSAAYEEVSI